MVNSPAVLSVKLALSVSTVPATSSKVCVLPASGSVAARVPMASPMPLFSAMELGFSAMFVGASFSSVIVMVNGSSMDSPP